MDMSPRYDRDYGSVQWGLRKGARQNVPLCPCTLKSPADIKSQYASASILPNSRVVFNVKGNEYRLVVAVRYDLEIVFIRFVGKHSQYDDIDATTI